MICLNNFFLNFLRIFFTNFFLRIFDDFFFVLLGCNSNIWTKVQINACFIYIDSTETNDTSGESSDTKLFGAGKSEGVALSGGNLP